MSFSMTLDIWTIFSVLFWGYYLVKTLKKASEYEISTATTTAAIAAGIGLTVALVARFAGVDLKPVLGTLVTLTPNILMFALVAAYFAPVVTPWLNMVGLKSLQRTLEWLIGVTFCFISFIPMGYADKADADMLRCVVNVAIGLHFLLSALHGAPPRKRRDPKIKLVPQGA